MEKYKLNELFLFLKRQQILGWVAIERVLDIMDDDSIPENKKKKLILSVFRQFGLYEIGCSREKCAKNEYKRVQASLKKEAQEDESNKLHRCLPLQFVEFNMLNGTITHGVPLN